MSSSGRCGTAGGVLEPDVASRRWRRRSSSARNCMRRVRGSRWAALAAELAQYRSGRKVYAVEHRAAGALHAGRVFAWRCRQLIEKLQPDAGAFPAYLSGPRFRPEARHRAATACWSAT